MYFQMSHKAERAWVLNLKQLAHMQLLTAQSKKHAVGRGLQ